MAQILLTHCNISATPEKLPTKAIFDSLRDVNAKPSGGTEGFSGISDSGVSESGSVNKPTITAVPYSYKNSGTSMSKIPYFFETPIPSFFRENGWFKDENTWKFVSWCFSRCSYMPRNISHDGKKLSLQPFMFIFGRNSCSEECHMTEDEVRAQQKKMEKNGFLIKCPNATPKRFTLYRWAYENFPNNPQVKGRQNSDFAKKPPSEPPSKQQKKYIENPQVNPQQTPNKPPSNPHNLDYRLEILDKEIPPLTPPNDYAPAPSKKNFSKNQKARKEVYQDVFVTKEEHEKLLEKWGSIEKLKTVYQEISKWKKNGTLHSDPNTHNDFNTALNWKIRFSKEQKILDGKILCQKIYEEYSSEYWKIELFSEGVTFYCPGAQNAGHDFKYEENGLPDKLDQILKKCGFRKKK